MTLTQALVELFVLEGYGYSVDPVPTFAGIIQSEYDSYRTAKGLQPQDVQQIDRSEIEDIYRDKYWNAMSCGSLPSGLDFAVFQAGVNVGTGKASMWLQKLLGVTQDGQIGPETLGALKGQDVPTLANAFLDLQDAYYSDIVSANPDRNQQYSDGWHNRVSITRVFISPYFNSGTVGAAVIAFVALAWLLLRRK